MRASAITSRARQPVEQRGFSGICVSDQRNGGERNRLPLAALRASSAAHAFQLIVELLDAAIDPPAVRFQLRFTRTARADAAAQAGHFRAPSGEARQQIIQLRQLHLQLPFARPGAAGENIQDQLRPVQNLAIERAFQIAKLGGRKFSVEQHHVGFMEIHQAAQFIQFAGADQRGRIGRLAGLNDGLFHARAGRVGESLHFFERFFGAMRPRVLAIAPRAGLQIQPDQNRAFLASWRQTAC